MNDTTIELFKTLHELEKEARAEYAASQNKLSFLAPGGHRAMQAVFDFKKKYRIDPAKYAAWKAQQ